MPVLEDSPYRPPKLFSNAHVQTIYPYFFRKIKDIRFEHKRIDTDDGDFLDLDILKNGSEDVYIISHGLEGSTQTQYVRGMARAFNYHQKDIIAWNMRSCSAEMNRTQRLYHSGATDDLERVINFAIELGYKRIFLIGFSLGANLTALYLGQRGQSIPSQIQKAMTISAPYDLKSSSMALTKIANRLYLENFLITMRAKMIEKHKLVGLENVDLKNLKKTKSFKEFDDFFTAPLHGFKDAEDYWASCSSIGELPNIKIPTLLLSALDDPFMGSECFPVKEANQNSNLFLELTKTGGHVGFVQFNEKRQYWTEKRAVDFFIHDKIQP